MASVLGPHGRGVLPVVYYPCTALGAPLPVYPSHAPLLYGQCPHTVVSTLNVRVAEGATTGSTTNGLRITDYEQLCYDSFYGLCGVRA